MYAENFTGSPPKWSPGTVIEVTGPLSYRVELQTGTSVRRHVDSLRKRQAVGDVGNHSGGSKILHPDPALHHYRYHTHPSVVLHDNASQGTDTARDLRGGSVVNSGHDMTLHHHHSITVSHYLYLCILQ